jgi:hypothetical protein
MPMARVRRRASTVNPATAISPMKSMPNVATTRSSTSPMSNELAGRGAIELISVL